MRNPSAALRLGLALAVAAAQFPASALAAGVEARESSPAAAWSGLLGGLSAPQTAALSRQLDVAWSPAVQAAIVHVMAGAEALPEAGDGQDPLAAIAPQIRKTIEFSAAQKAAQVQSIADGASISPGDVLGDDLAALNELKGALKDGSIRLSLQNERVQATIAAARAWNDKSAPEVSQSAVGKTGGIRLTLGRPDAAARRTDVDGHFGTRAPPVPGASAAEPPGLSERWSGVLSSARQKVLGAFGSAAPASAQAEISIGEFVSVLRAVNNLTPERAQAYRDRYPDWFSDAGSLAKAAAELNATESLTPARLDTVIFNQGGEKDDAVVELTNNGVDTLLEKAGFKALVGRFGVGAFQTLQELEHPGDQVILETATRPGKVLRVTFSIDENANPDKIGEQVKMRLESVPDKSFGTGTSVRVRKAEGLSAQRQEALKTKLATKLGQSMRAPISVNGRLINSLEDWKDIDGNAPAHAISEQARVNISDEGYELRDAGLGMSEATILEKFLLPRRSTKAAKVQKVDEAAVREQTRLLYRGDRNGSPGEFNTMKVTLGVSGVAVESFEVEGLNLPQEVFLDLPPGSWLPESRNKIEVTPEVWAGLKGLMEKVLASDLEKNLGLLNAVAAIGGYLENPRTHPEAAKTGESFSRFMSERLDRVPGLKKLTEFQGAGGRAYAMDLKSKGQVYLKYGPNLIFDRRIYDKYKDYPVLLNLLLNFRIGYGDQKTSKGAFPVSKKNGAEIVQAPALNAMDRMIEDALSRTAWYAGVKEKNAGILHARLTALLGKLPEDERWTALREEIVKLGVFAQFAREHVPQADWSRALASVSNAPYLDRTFNYVSRVVTEIGGQPAFVARQGDKTSVYIAGTEVWSTSGSLQKAEAVGGVVAVDAGWALMFRTRESEPKYFLIVNGEVAWRGGNAGPLISVDGKPAFFTRDSSRNRLEVRVGETITRFDGVKSSDDVRNFTPIGTRFALRLVQGTRSTVYLGRNAVWSGPAQDVESTLLDVHGRLFFAAKSDDGTWRMFVDGEIRSTGYAWLSAPVLISGRAGYLAKLPDDKIYMNISGKPGWLSDFSTRFVPRGVTASDGHWAFAVRRSSGEKRLVVDGKIFPCPDLEDIKFFVGDKLVFTTYGSKYNVLTHDGERQSFGGVVAFGDRIAHYESMPAREGIPYPYQLYVDGQPAGILSGINGFSWAAGALFYADGSAAGEMSIRRITLDESPALDVKALEDRSIRSFARAHDYDLRDSERPWGERYLKGLLDKTPDGLSRADVQPLLPFLAEEERRGLGPETVRRFGELVAKEPWEKIEQVSEFARAVRPLTQDAEEYDRWVGRWLTVVDADWSRAKELLEQLKKTHVVGAQAQPFLLSQEERSGLKVPTLLRYDAFIAAEPMDRIAKLLEFMRAVRPLARDLGQYDDWVKTWMVLVANDLDDLIKTIHEQLHGISARQGQSGLAETNEWLINAHFGRNFKMPADGWKAAGQDSASEIQGYQFLKSDQDLKRAPGHLRGYLYYLRAAKAELLKERPVEKPAAAPLRERIADIPAALLTIARRQRAALIAKPGLTLTSYKRVLDGLKGYSTAGMEEEIESAIRGQDQGDMLWVRELIQNSRDALRRAWREGALPKGQGNVAVDSYKQGDEWVVRVQDPVGMDLNKLVNYFFPLDESDKTAGVDAGRFGQGLYTLFGDFDQVHVKSGAGDGKVYDVVVTRKEGKLWIESFEERAGDYRGTTIERVKRLDREQRIPVELEAAFVTSAVYEYAGAVQNVDILYQGERANESVTELSSVAVGDLGRLSVLESASRLSRITQDDLSVSDPGLQAELTALFPDWMRKLWQERGYTIDLPEKLPLVRSRAGLAQKEKVLSDLQEAMLALGVQLAVKLYFSEGFALPGLPQDFYYDKGSNAMDPTTVADAAALNSGRWPEINWSRYAKDGLALGRLMALTQARVGVKTVTPWEIREEIRAGRSIKEIPVAASLGDLLTQSVEQVRQQRLDAAKPEKVYKEKEVEESPELRDFRDLNMEILRVLGEKSGWKIRFYSRENDVLANFRNKTISWNLHNARSLVSRWKSIAEGDDAGVDAFFYDFLETFMHEYTHFSDGDWTHHADETLENGFAWRMKRNIEKLTVAGLDIPALVRRRRATAHPIRR